MSKPGAKNPEAGVPVTLVITANTKVAASGFRIVVATQGSLFVKYLKSDAVCELTYPAGGPYWEPGEFKEIWSDGVLVTLPAATIIKY